MLRDYGEIILDTEFWDCECPDHYIHPVKDEICPKCGATQEESPSSRALEVANPENHFKE
ncbi:MAG: hypothetical protein HPY53_01535 [Brevinematales bacterium]|nr:hypothetical protein [Brevinematales bacterium]